MKATCVCVLPNRLQFGGNKEGGVPVQVGVGQQAIEALDVSGLRAEYGPELRYS